ncbi:sigma-70 family RNA polymerase sigma factor [uncultured Microscilla sp.]|uniref:RNA polymerase sigma factor n=1 Tax=uncultured Microscilla sp. TaxID=432653 RepID=UPI00261B4F11|nr:sigma-70 family RNA polymerase sigma factor [uncultured Microscilla sp.]
MKKKSIEGVIAALFNDQKLYKALLAKAQQVLQNDAESIDVVNDAYIKLFEELNQGKEVANMPGFLWGTCYRKAVDVLRKRQHSLQYVAHCKATFSSSQICRQMKRFEQVGEWNHWLSQLHLTKDELTLFGYIQQEYTNQEIAQVLNIPPDEIRKKKFSLKRKFQKLVKRTS